MASKELIGFVDCAGPIPIPSDRFALYDLEHPPHHRSPPSNNQPNRTSVTESTPPDLLPCVFFFFAASPRLVRGKLATTEKSSDHEDFLSFTGAQSKEEGAYPLPSSMAVATEAQFHVLAVDDSLLDRKLIERLLKTSSFQVTAVDSGSKALEFLGLHDHEESPISDQLDVAVNLIITDYCMPGMTGYDLLKKIKESSYLRDIPVVIMSSDNIPSRINRCLEEGADEFLLKPVRLSDMSKLKPHILKSRCKEHYEQEQHLQSNSSSNSHKRKAADDEILPSPIRPRHC
ncbi:hypothetical protein GUJ93_ZPchr0011g28437 [Zizania palustris]|uniref:Response regulatory domain-containing protein n=1 Tax=Zizania palustris TaxID=103762 RepID=A0A8J5WI20_ZIZPA|nr:hypothetical protein GUJ93_ZPchr0011g28437 [Zizania palustris]